MSEFTPGVVREQVAAAARDIGRAATAREIGGLLNYSSLTVCRDTCHTYDNGSRFHRHLEDLGLDVSGYRQMTSGCTREHLEALARRGLVEKSKVGRSVYWRWVGDQVDMGSVSHLDFPAPSEVDLAIESLVALGVRVERVADPIVATDGKKWPGSIERRSNGPIRYFLVELWQGAEPSRTLAALRKAEAVVSSPDDRKHLDDGGLCLG